MPDFTVIDGGGQPRDVDSELAATALRRVFVELLRAAVRGDDPELRLTHQLFQFLEYIHKARTPVASIADGVITGVRQDLDEMRTEDEEKLVRIVDAALRVTAEALAEDGAAATRLMSRERDLIGNIERYLIAHEERARESGFSHLGEQLTRHFGDRPRTIKPRPPRNPLIL
jgi:hypothetical protein